MYGILCVLGFNIIILNSIGLLPEADPANTLFLIGTVWPVVCYQLPNRLQSAAQESTLYVYAIMNVV